jgi:homoserine kinase
MVRTWALWPPCAVACALHRTTIAPSAIWSCWRWLHLLFLPWSLGSMKAKTRKTRRSLPSRTRLLAEGRLSRTLLLMTSSHCPQPMQLMRRMGSSSSLSSMLRTSWSPPARIARPLPQTELHTLLICKSLSGPTMSMFSCPSSTSDISTTSPTPSSTLPPSPPSTTRRLHSPGRGPWLRP